MMIVAVSETMGNQRTVVSETKVGGEQLCVWEEDAGMGHGENIGCGREPDSL